MGKTDMSSEEVQKIIDERYAAEYRAARLEYKLNGANALLDEIQEKILGGNYATSAVRKRLEEILAKRKDGDRSRSDEAHARSLLLQEDDERF